MPAAVTKPEPVLLDGATLTPRKLALIAREGAVAELTGDAHARNDDAREALAAYLAARRAGVRGHDRSRGAA